MTVISEAAEEIRKAAKKEKMLLLSTRHNGKLKEIFVDWFRFLELVKPETSDDIVIHAEFTAKTIGETVLNADTDDYDALLRRLWMILKEKTITSAGKVKRALEVLETFDAEHKEKLDESYIHDTIDK